MKKSIYLFVLAAVFFAACNSKSKDDSRPAGEHPEMSPHSEEHDHSHMGAEKGSAPDASSITVQASGAVTAILDAYLELGDGLANDNSSAAAASGKKLFAAVKSFAPSSVPQDRESELNEIMEDAKEHAEHISENNGNIEHQREHFETLSIDVKDLVTIAGTDRPLYQEFCPMYNDKKGAMWLSASSEIRNPFFGSKMPNCGNVQAEITMK